MDNSSRQRLIARLYLEAVLPTLSPLIQFDRTAKDLIDGQHFGVRFDAGDRLEGRIVFDTNSPAGAGATTEAIDGVPVLNLWLPSASQCVRLFSKSGLALPIPVGGWQVLPKMTLFQQLTDRLEAVLQPDAEALSDETFLRHHVFCSLHLAVHALPAMLELDPEGKSVLSSAKKGIAEFKYHPDTFPSLWLDLRSDHPIAGTGKPPASPLVTLNFCNDETAVQAMANRLDGLAALGRGDLVLEGFVPLADSLDLVMARIQPYLKP
ncbi:MAG: hypothetical protein AAF571_03070 [Verrucomicrobiota bacterium]